MSSNFPDRPFELVPGGHYDTNGFYVAPDGSFWDPDGVYFNKDGFDRHKGYYDDQLHYQPGPGWDADLLCYEDEKDNFTGGQLRHRDDDLDEAGDDLDNIDELYENVDFDKIMNEGSSSELNENYINEKNVFKPVRQENKIIEKSLVINSTNIIPTVNETKHNVIPSDILFQEIPENKKPKEMQNLNSKTTTIVEKHIEIDDLFQ